MLLFLFSALLAVGFGEEVSSALCQKTQKCINKASINCWLDFYRKNLASENPLLKDLFQCVPRNVFLRLVTGVEGVHFPNMTKADDLINECMQGKGFTENVDYCADWRATKSLLPNNALVQEMAGKVAPDDSCWSTGLDDCMLENNIGSVAVNEALLACSSVETNSLGQTADAIEANEATKIGEELILDIFQECKIRLLHLIETMKELKQKEGFGDSEADRQQVRYVQNLCDMLGIPDDDVQALDA